MAADSSYLGPTIMFGLTALTGFLTVKGWRSPLSSRFYRAPQSWPWSPRTWLAIKAGDAASVGFFLTGGLVLTAPSSLVNYAIVLSLATVVLLAALALFGWPGFMMPPAVRAAFQGLLRPDPPPRIEHRTGEAAPSP